MSTLKTTNIAHPSSASNNIVLDSSGGVDLDALTVSGSAPADSVNIDSGGRLLIGTSTSRNDFFNNTSTVAGGIQLELSASNNLNRFMTFTSNNSDTGGPCFIFGKSRGTSANSKTIVQADDIIAQLSFQAADGSDMVPAAQISAAIDGTPGANDMPGRIVLSTTADGASSPTERMRITSGGDLLANTTTVSFAQNKAWVSTNFTSNEGIISQGYLAAAAYFNRQGNDGTIINLLQGGEIEGTISVSGTTVSYNGAHLSRWSQLPGGAERTEILRGSVLSNLDEMCEWGEEDNEQLNRMKVSDVEGDKNVSGVFQAWDDDDDTYTDDFYCAMTGDFIIRIGDGVTVERGDLLMSAGDGTAKPQDDDIIRSKTIAKVTSTNVSCTYDDGSYCVPCVLMAC